MSDSETNLFCFVCNSQAGVSFDIFSDNVILPSGAKLQGRLSEIIDHRLEENKLHSSIICKMCYRVCKVYDEIQKRSAEIKTEMTDVFRRTLKNYNLDYAGHSHPRPHTPIGNITELPGTNDKKASPEVKRLVLPKSKLKPIPSDMVILNSKMAFGNVTKTLAIKNSVFVSPNKVVISPGSSLIKPQTAQCLEQTSPLKTPINSPSKLHTTASSPSLAPDALNHMLRELEKIPKNNHFEQFDDGTPRQPSSVIDRAFHSIFEDRGMSQNKPSQRQDSDDNMILDELEGTIRKKTANELTSAAESGSKGNNEEQYVMEVEVLDENDLDGDDDSVLTEQDDSILHVVRGNKGQLLFTGNNEISLMMSDEGDKGTEASQNSTSAGLPQFKIECQDSNDDSQIELQMSGDEETANAIIDAAREHGATYIKMENGAMYRINTVESQREVDSDGPLDECDQPVVERNGEKGYKCLLCPTMEDKPLEHSEEEASVFSDAPAAMEHVATVHNARANICQICGDIFENRTDLSQHIAEHGRLQKQSAPSTKQHYCSVCSKKFSTKSQLQEHAKQHTVPKPHRCPSCQKEFGSKYSYHAHLKTHTDRPRPYKCPRCNKAFLTLHNLSQHEHTHSAVKTFSCPTCHKSFATQHNLDSHMMIHSGHKPFICGVCEKAFTRRTEIKDHMRTHTGERPFQCDICEAKFSQRSNLMSHRRLTHLNDKRHACNSCDKKFKRRRLLEYHIKSCHTGERPFKCEVCGSTFVYPEHYKKHLRIHSGQKPFDCEVCGKTFNSRDNRNAHRYIHSDKKPFECLVCGVGYMRKPQLYAHMELRGHQAETIIVNQPQLTVGGVTLHVSDMPEATSMEQPSDAKAVRVLGSFSTPPKSDIPEDPLAVTKTEIEGSREIDDDTEAEPVEGTSKMFFIQGDHKLYSTVQMEGCEATEGHLMFAAADQLTEGAEQLEVAGEAEGAAGAEHDTQVDISKLLAQADSHIVDEHGNIIRLVQIQLPDGKEGWVAIDP